MSYCTVSDIREYLDIEGGGDDALIDMLIAAAEQAIDRHCNRTFEAISDSTFYIDAVGEHVRGRSLFFDTIGDLCDITTVTNGDGVEVASDEYVTIPRNETPYYGLRLLNSAGKVWTYAADWESAISIAGKWAYSETAPNDVKQACIRWASYLYRQKDAPVFDTTAIPEAGVITTPQGIPVDVRNLLAPYRRL
jgi:hypothetical protein